MKCLLVDGAQSEAAAQVQLRATEQCQGGLIELLLGGRFPQLLEQLRPGLPWKLGTLFACRRTDTPLQLDHTIVPAYDKVKPAEFIARIFGLKYEGPWGHLAPVKVNDILTLDFDGSDRLVKPRLDDFLEISNSVLPLPARAFGHN